MSVRVFEDQGAAELNKAVKIGRVESVGPVTMSVNNLDDDANLVLSFENEQTGTQIFTDKDTAVAAEDSGYDGDTSEVAFTGQVLNSLPVVPKSVTDANARQKAATRVLRAQALRNNVTPASRSYEAKANYAMRQAYHAMTAQIQAVASMEEKK